MAYPGKRQTSQEAGTEGQRLKLPARQIDTPEVAGAGIQQPEFAAIDARGVRHRQAGGDDLVRLHINHDAAVPSPIAPTISHVADADCRDVAGLTVLQGQPIQVAAILRCQLAQEGGPPQWCEAGLVAKRGQAAEAGVDEDHSAARLHRDVMDIKVAGRVTDSGHVEPIRAVVELARRQRVFEPPKLEDRTEPKCLAIAIQTHTTIEGAFEHRHPPIGLQAEEEELTRLIGREGQAETLLGQPGREMA